MARRHLRVAAAAASAVLFLAACGATGTTDDPVDGSGLQPPRADPPTGGGGYPPPAWISTARGAHWLGYATFCWENMCADSAGPMCGDAHTPEIDLDRGERVTFHVGFLPRRAWLGFFAEDETVPLRAAREMRWTVDRQGPVWLSTTVGPGRDAHYAACLRVRGEEAAPPTRSVAEVLDARPGGEVRVRGIVYADGEDVRLCEALAESHPPQCAGGSLRLEGFALDDVDGLSRAGAVSWSDPTTLTGRLRGDTFVVASP